MDAKGANGSYSSISWGVNISEDLIWRTHTSEIVKRGEKRLFTDGSQKKNNIREKLLVCFNHCRVENALTYCLFPWLFSCTLAQRTEVHRVIQVAQQIIGYPLCSLLGRCLKHIERIF